MKPANNNRLLQPFCVDGTGNMDEDAPPEYQDIVSTRAYRDNDRDRCVALSVEAWPKMSAALPGGAAADFWAILVDLAHDYADWREVACVSDSVVGFIFGRSVRSSSPRESIGFGWRFLSGMYNVARKSSFADMIPVFCACVLSELKIQFKNPSCDSEVAFLVVDSEHRGKGVGKRLLRMFIDHARSNGRRSISVYTTDPGCNWGFYEALGFEKAVEFDDDVGTYLEGSPSRGLIFTLDLRTEERRYRHR